MAASRFTERDFLKIQRIEDQRWLICLALAFLLHAVLAGVFLIVSPLLRDRLPREEAVIVSVAPGLPEAMPVAGAPSAASAPAAREQPGETPAPPETAPPQNSPTPESAQTPSPPAQPPQAAAAPPSAGPISLEPTRRKQKVARENRAQDERAREEALKLAREQERKRAEERRRVREQERRQEEADLLARQRQREEAQRLAQERQQRQQREERRRREADERKLARELEQRQKLREAETRRQEEERVRREAEQRLAEKVEEQRRKAQQRREEARRRAARAEAARQAEADARRAREELASMRAEDRSRTGERPGRPQAATGRQAGASGVEGQYWSLVAQRLRGYWKLPEGRTWSGSLLARVELTINNDGQVSRIAFASRSGDPHFDQLVENTIRRASPMPRFPATMRQGSTKVGFRFRPGGLGRM